MGAMGRVCTKIKDYIKRPQNKQWTIKFYYIDKEREDEDYVICAQSPDCSWGYTSVTRLMCGRRGASAAQRVKSNKGGTRILNSPHSHLAHLQTQGRSLAKISCAFLKIFPFRQIWFFCLDFSFPFLFHLFEFFSFYPITHGIMGTGIPAGGLLRYRKWVPQQLLEMQQTCSCVLSNKGVPQFWKM